MMQSTENIEVRRFIILQSPSEVKPVKVNSLVAITNEKSAFPASVDFHLTAFPAMNSMAQVNHTYLIK